jgi:hypothetical protein
MAVQTVLDITDRVNAEMFIEIGGYDYAVFQFIGVKGTASFNSTNNSGEIGGVTEGNANLATNGISIKALSLNSMSIVDTISDDGMIKFEGVGRFIQIAGGAFTKVLMRLYKIN